MDIFRLELKTYGENWEEKMKSTPVSWLKFKTEYFCEKFTKKKLGLVQRETLIFILTLSVVIQSVTKTNLYFGMIFLIERTSGNPGFLLDYFYECVRPQH